MSEECDTERMFPRILVGSLDVNPVAEVRSLSVMKLIFPQSIFKYTIRFNFFCFVIMRIF